MNVTFACPHCHEASREEFTADSRHLDCSHCGQKIQIPADAVVGQKLTRCLVCPSTDLFIRKDFPQRLGVALVAVGIIGSSIAWGYGQLLWTFGFLFATALVDLLLYAMVGNQLMCYRCEAQYRGVVETDIYGPFSLETHERYRQQAARLRESERRQASASAAPS